MGLPIQIGAEAGTSTPPHRYCSGFHARRGCTELGYTEAREVLFKSAIPTKADIGPARWNVR